MAPAKFLQDTLASLRKKSWKEIRKQSALHLGLLLCNFLWGWTALLTIEGTNNWLAAIALKQVTPYVYHGFRCALLGPPLAAYCLLRHRAQLLPDSWAQFGRLMVMTSMGMGFTK